MELYMTDSRGNVKNASEKEKLSGNLQKERLIKFSDFMKKCLLKTGVQVSPDYFDLMVQPNGEYDGLLYFSKIPLDSSAGILRRKIAVTRGEFIPESAERLLLDSIFEVRENGKPCWYQLMVNKILLQRNMLDNQWIAVRQDTPVPYCCFKSEWDKMIYRKGENESPTAFALLSKRNYGDTAMLLQTARLQETINENTDKVISYYTRKALFSCDIYSNDKTMFLYQLAEQQPEIAEVYRDFKLMKIFLKKLTGKRAYLHYEGQDMIWHTGNEEIRFHVCKNESYNIYGYFYNMEELKQQIAGEIPFQQKVWYRSLMPFFGDNRYIEERKRSKR